MTWFLGELIVDPKCSPIKQSSEISLWERLGKASMLDIESSLFSWNMLSSLHHTEHSSNSDPSEEDQIKALEVTVNSGGVVFFALFNHANSDDASPKEAAAVIKFSSSRMATQSERLGYEFAKWLGVQTPQARVIHNSNPEWTLIKEATEKAQVKANSEGDEVGEMTCSELLEALELSRCLFLMSYVHGCPLLESTNIFESEEKAEKVAAALGRILVLDLVIRNEDRLPSRQLRWRGNPANLLLADKVPSPAKKLECSYEEAFDSAIKRHHPRVYRAIQKERRATSVDSRFGPSDQRLVSQASDLSDVTESPKSCDTGLMSPLSDRSVVADFHIVAIDSGVPRRPPAGKRASDREIYPKLVELLINSSEYASNLLHEITEGKLGTPRVEEDGEQTGIRSSEVTLVIREFRNGFRAGLRDLQGFHIFLVTLHQKLDGLLRAFFTMMDKTMCPDFDREEFAIPESPSQAPALDPSCYPSPSNKERIPTDNNSDYSESEMQKTALRTPFSENRESSDATSPKSRESWHGKSNRGGESLSSQRLAAKLRDFHKFAKVDAESSKEIEQWNETLQHNVLKLCQENNFNTGFFEGSDNNICTDAYELKVRLEHILERVSLICKAANTEKPSMVMNNLFIGGGLAARSVYTLQHLGITHILCLCANEIGQSDTQYPGLFEYINFSITDDEDANIESIFEEALDFIDHGEQTGGKVLVHCFEGRSRSSTVVLAYLMLRKNLTLLEAWETLKKVHRRAQPNDGFARILLNLEKKRFGKVSMEWRRRKPTMKVCPVCGKNAGLSSSSLKLHLQKSHKKLSSGSVDSAMNMEIQKALDALKLNSSRGSSVSPKSFHSHSGMESPV
ncbi:PREDICTED: dual specificity protein phosphatase PHS1 isoform X2 [Tarenaya hassleriana]|uniref:dual specificity protein phosphatase PHS1 isoform X2 n=1 Tax=Tarenaya hassleriana TaxID=28532 RepID=UPI00053C8A68|nr:PREDICTED: dual specificity protein phosphatase PHS1 isoform X2 [Tarenaya hassleriana]